LNTVDDRYNNNASIDHNTKREIDSEMNAPPKTLTSAKREVPLKQLFSHVNKLTPTTTTKYGAFHLGADLIRAKSSFDGNNIVNGFIIQPPAKYDWIYAQEIYKRHLPFLL
jgi:hypothetical protein